MTTRFLFRGGCVLTLGAKTPNFAEADLLVEDDRVVEVGPGVRARDAEVVDASDAIVMPGFVDTHRHAWRSLFRNLGAIDAEGVSMAAALSGEHIRPDDVYAGTLIGLLGAVEAGITTVVDWSEAAEQASVDAALQAHADAGLRTVFVDGGRSGGGSDERDSTRHRLARLTEAAGPSTTVAVGFAGPRPAEAERDAGDWTAARELGTGIHVHVDPTTWGPGGIADMAARGLLGRDVTLVHRPELSGDDVDAIAASGASISLSPTSEMAAGLGSPPIQQLIDRDIRPALGVDDERVAPGDMFAQMRAAISVQHATVFDRKLAGKAGLPRLMSTRDVIRYATVEGARAAGFGGVIGSLEPGMRADVVVLRTDRPNVFPINDPIGAVVWGMDTSNVDWVVAAGRVLVRDGVLEADVRRARDLATEARDRVAAAAGLPVGATSGAG